MDTPGLGRHTIGAELLSAEVVVVVVEPGPGFELDYETDF